MRVIFFVIIALPSYSEAKAQVNAEMVTLMGRNAISVDDYITAIRYFNQAIEAKPYLSRPYYYRAYAKFTLEDYMGAEADCSKSIELNPFITEVYQLRGLCRIHNDNFKGAIEDYEHALKEQPDEQSARYNKALCHLQLKQYAEANKDLDYILKHWPNYYRCYMVKAQAALEQKDTIQGIKWVDKLLSKNPKDGNALGFKGRFALQKKDYALADSCLTLAIQQSPKDFSLYIARAQARHGLDLFDLAISDYNQTIELQPQHFVAHYNRGLLRSFVGDLNRAIEDFSFILRIEPNNVLARYNRAQLYANVGKFREAIKDYTSLIKEFPNFTYGYQARAECRRKIGDTKGAIQDETFVARQELDIIYGKKSPQNIQKVKLRSEHELDHYQQLIEEKTDTTRNIFGTLYGKVQNERVANELLPMYIPAFRTVHAHGYHSVGFTTEISKLSQANSSTRVFCLSAEQELSSASEAEIDAERFQSVKTKISTFCQALIQSSIDAARYDYESALQHANQALQADSASVLSLMQKAYIICRKITGQPSESKDAQKQFEYAMTNLKHAARLAPENAYIIYNLGCLFAQKKATSIAIDTFTQALKLDPHLPEAYYNRGLLYFKLGDKDKAKADLSRAGQLGLYKAYAQIKQIEKK